MYREAIKNQQEIEDFYLPFGGHLNDKNRWVILSLKIPWQRLEEDYSSYFSPDQGAPAKSVTKVIPTKILCNLHLCLLFVLGVAAIFWRDRMIFFFRMIRRNLKINDGRCPRN